MPATDRLLPDLGPDFDARWKRASQALRRELVAEIRSVYRLLEDDDVPMLDALAPPVTGAATPARRVTAPPQQTSLFDATGTKAKADLSDNPFLPASVRQRLRHGNSPTAPQTPSPLQATPPPPSPSHEHVDLERELRLRLGPIIESLIESHMDTLRGELRLRLRAEMDRLITEHLQISQVPHRK